MQRREFIKTAAMAAGMPFLFGGCRTFRGNSKINVAIIGCGRMLLPLWRKAQVHARIREED